MWRPESSGSLSSSGCRGCPQGGLTTEDEAGTSGLETPFNLARRCQRPKGAQSPEALVLQPQAQQQHRHEHGPEDLQLHHRGGGQVGFGVLRHGVGGRGQTAKRPPA